MTADIKRRLLKALQRRRTALAREAEELEGVRAELDVVDGLCCNALWCIDDAIEKLRLVKVRPRWEVRPWRSHRRAA